MCNPFRQRLTKEQKKKKDPSSKSLKTYFVLCAFISADHTKHRKNTPPPPHTRCPDVWVCMWILCVSEFSLPRMHGHGTSFEDEHVIYEGVDTPKPCFRKRKKKWEGNKMGEGAQQPPKPPETATLDGNSSFSLSLSRTLLWMNTASGVSLILTQWRQCWQAPLLSYIDPMFDRVGVQRCHSCQQQQAWENKAKVSRNVLICIFKGSVSCYWSCFGVLFFFCFFTATLLQQAAVELINKLLVGGLQATTGGNQRCLVSLPSYQT